MRKGELFDFGNGWAEVNSLFPGSRLCVFIRIQSGAPVSSRQCRSLADFLMRAADWIDEHYMPSDCPEGVVVYVITDGHSHHKIGKAVNFQKRLKQLQTGNGRRLRLVAYLRTDDEHIAYVAETAAKRSLDAFKAVGEWFECNSHHAFQALHEAAHEAGIECRPVSVCVGHDDGLEQEATDGR